MAKLLKRLGKGYWLVRELSHKQPVKRKVHRGVTRSGKIERWVIINKRRVKVF